MIQWRLTPRSERNLKRFNAKLAGHGNSRAVRLRLRRALRDGAQPTLQRVKMAALSLPSKGTKSPVHGERNMRRRIAGATRLQIRTARDPGVGIAINQKFLPDDAIYLPKRMNEGHWRHPVFRDTVWVSQKSTFGWFDTAITRGQPDVQRTLTKTIDDFTRRIS